MLLPVSWWGEPQILGISGTMVHTRTGPSDLRADSGCQLRLAHAPFLRPPVFSPEQEDAVPARVCVIHYLLRVSPIPTALASHTS